MKALATVRGQAMMTALAALTLTAGFVCPVRAQTVPDTEVESSVDVIPKLSYGVRASFNVATFTGETADGLESGGLPGAGLFATYRLSPFMALQPELLYTRKSVGMLRMRTSPPAASVDVNLNYLEFPVLLKFSLPQQQHTTPILLAGPYVSRRLTGSIEDANGIFEKRESDDLIRRFDYGVVVGTGLESYIGRRHINFDARYSLGLTHLLDTSDERDLYNRGFTMSIGLGL
jgi:hypothetical protein